MLNYDEEVKKFQPSLEVEDIEGAVYQEDLSDMTDIIREMMEQTKYRGLYGLFNETRVPVQLLV